MSPCRHRSARAECSLCRQPKRRNGRLDHAKNIAVVRHLCFSQNRHSDKRSGWAEKRIVACGTDQSSLQVLNAQLLESWEHHLETEVENDP
jgi:hypothetical protein